MIINFIAFIIVENQNKFIGDFVDFDLRSSGDLFLTFLLLAGVIFAMLLFYNGVSKIKIRSRPINYSHGAMSVFIGCMLISFIAYVQVTQLFIAGSAARGGSVGSAFWALMNVDMIFTVYYASCRNSKYFKWNLGLWVISFVQRGWFAIFFTIVAFESFRFIRSGKAGYRMLLVMILLVALYPILDIVKVYIRVNEIFDPVVLFDMVRSEITSPGFTWLGAFSESTGKIIGRIQVLSHAQMLIDNHAYFAQSINVGKLVPFWKEGLIGVVWDTLTGIPHAPELPSVVATFIAPDSMSSWNVNPSLIGWFSVYGDYVPLSIIYVMLLGVVSIVLGKFASDTIFFRDILWFVWLMFFIPGWIAQFITFLVAMTIYLLVASVLRVVRPVRRPKVVEFA
ncbi:hypothetical protein EIL82_04345 [Pandoraea apista]|uniref:Oligosaccharide repeat unit polymerase n=1 Tax=Pandoraea apista TaxID=93218 RepID=A0ABX9ZPN1_9BURK|nr:hypothetical protein EIB05_11625 [Pandoraea apista]RRJ81319.1 hypothetical protein EIL82_04345 [Pandoraea apista]RSC97810.1 hypothetical protein EJB12_24195 [Pandoraea apista]RSD15568.1 hypothetical protein EIZ52_16330 [Pandoraea apista]RSK80506.1 hypothetical protein EJE83_13015 [Pandoraea apista]